MDTQTLELKSPVDEYQANLARLPTIARWIDSFDAGRHVQDRTPTGESWIVRVAVDVGRRRALLVACKDPMREFAMLEEISAAGATVAQLCERVLAVAGRWGYSSEHIEQWIVLQDEDRDRATQLRSTVQVLLGNPKPPVVRARRGVGSVSHTAGWLYAMFELDQAWVNPRCPAFIQFAETFTGDSRHPGRADFALVGAALRAGGLPSADLRRGHG